MLPSSDALLTSQPSSRVLLGVLIDVSDSMRKSWPNKDGKQLPRIEVIRDVLNRRIQEEQRRSQTQKSKLENIDVFCLGLGFRFPYYIVHDIGVAEQEQPLNKKELEPQEFTDLICDLLALCEILPTKEKLSDFKERLNQKWQECTKNIFDQAEIVEDVFGQLVDYIEPDMYASAMRRHQRGLLYKLTHRFHWLASFFSEGLQRKEEQIKITSKRAADQYIADVFAQARNDFKNNQEKYVNLITHHIEKFVKDYVAATLQALTLGFSPTEIVDHLDENQTISLAEKIYADLDKEVREHIEKVLRRYLRNLRSEQKSISAKLDLKQVIHLTKRFIQKEGWAYLRPLIEDTIYTMLTRQFESQAEENFSHWLRLASAREVVRPLAKLSSILPAIFEEKVYSDQVMFGSTPFRKAIDLAAMRFVDETYKDHRKVLIIISDGSFRDELEVMVSADLLKKRGVTIISCLIHERNLLEHFTRSSSKELPTGAKRMIEIASEQPEQSNQPADTRQRHLSRALMGKKLCYQINHSRLLDVIVENVFEEYAASDDNAPGRSKRSAKGKVTRSVLK